MSDNQSINKRIAKNTFFMYIRSILILFVSLYTSRVLLQQLGQEDFGIYNVVAGFVMLLTFLNTAMVNSTQRFLNNCLGKQDYNSYNNIFRTSLFIQILFALLIIIVAETIGLWFVTNKLNISPERETAAFFVYQFGLLSFVLKILQAPFSAIIVSKEKMDFYALQGIIEAILLLLVSQALQFSSYDKLIFYSILIALVSIAIFVLNFYYVKHAVKGVVYKPLFEKKSFRELLAFSGWNIFGSLSTIAKSQGLNIILNIFFDVIVNAARGIATQVFSGVSTFIANFQTAFKPQLIQSYAIGDFERYKNLTFMGSKVSAFIMWIFTLPIILSVDSLLSLWLGNGNVPLHANSFTIIALLTGLVDTYASPIAIAVSANGNIKSFQILVSCFKLLIVPLAFFACTNNASPESVLILGLFLDVIAVGVRLFIWKRIENRISIVVYCRSVLLPTISLILFSYFTSKSIIDSFNLSGFVHIFLSTIVSLLINIPLMLLIGVNKSERSILLRKFKLKNH